jgi:uncharacterized protein (TIGR03437 family)
MNHPLKHSLLLTCFAAAAWAQTPTVSAVVNSSSYAPPLCPGLLATIYGTNFGTNAAAVSVTVGGAAAYVLPAITANQFSVVLPASIPVGATTLVVTVGGAASAPFNITLSAYSPSFLIQNSAGSGLAAVYESTGSTLVTQAAPAHSGDAVYTYAIGLGATNPPFVPGVVATSTAPTATTPTVTVGGVAAKVAFAGLPQGLAGGLYQINFTVPAGLQGTQPIVLSIGGVTSSSTVTLAMAGVTSLVSNATFANPGIASPGSIATVFANSIGTAANQTAIFPATSAEGVQVTFNGVATPLFHVIGAGAQQQIDLLVPTELPTTGTVQVQLRTASNFYANYALTMAPSNPGFYRIQDPKVATRQNVIAQFNGTAWLALPASTTAALGLAACTTGTNVLSECGKPATIGDYLVLYATGLGLTTPGGDPNGKPLATGSVPPIDGSVLYETPTTPVVTIGGVSAKVLFSGLTPGYPGEYEIVVQVPSGVASGDDIPVSVTILGATDNSVTVSIQPAAQ